MKKAYSLTYKGSQQWFRIRENEFILNMHEGNFQAAVEVFFTTISSKSFDSLIQLGKDRWLLYEAYAHFLIEGASLTIVENVAFLK